MITLKNCFAKVHDVIMTLPSRFLELLLEKGCFRKYRKVKFIMVMLRLNRFSKGWKRERKKKTIVTSVINFSKQ